MTKTPDNDNQQQKTDKSIPDNATNNTPEDAQINPQALEEQPEKEQPVKEQPEKQQPEKEQPEKEHPEKEQPEKEQPEKEEPEKEEPEKEQSEKEEPEKEQPEKEQPEKEEPATPTLEQQLAELKDKYIRLSADFDNYRKRMAREAGETRERAKITVIADFLPVYDYFLMAMNHAEQPDDINNINALKQGMQMILNEFKRALDNLGVTEIPAKGKPFDPAVHEAAKVEQTTDIPEGNVIDQWRAGYKIGDKLIRPSTVVVSAGPEPDEKKENNNTTEPDADAKK